MTHKYVIGGYTFNINRRKHKNMSTNKQQYLHVLSRGVALAAVTLMATACAVTSTVEENPVAAELAPMQKPVLSAGQRVYQFDQLKNEEKYYEILEIRADGTHVGQSSNGCKWEASSDHVSPSLSWEECSTNPDWHSGENRDIKKKGEIWPLEVGNKVSYSYTEINAHGKNTGKSKRSCKVEDTVRIAVSAGELDAFKVVCKRSKGNWSQTRVYYFSPELGMNAKFVQSSSSKGVEDNSEFLRIEQI